MNKKLVNIAEKTLKISEKKSWELIRINEILNQNDLKQNSVDLKIKNKKDLLMNVIKYFDFKIKQSSQYIEKSTKKDMIFEVIMMRIDYLQTYRKAINNRD